MQFANTSETRWDESVRNITKGHIFIYSSIKNTNDNELSVM